MKQPNRQKTENQADATWLQIKAKIKDAHETEVNNNKAFENQVKQIIKEVETKSSVKK